MTLPHVLFPDNNPPPFSNNRSLDEGMIWLLAVMDNDDPSRRFVASVLTHFLSYGEVSQKQFSALQRILQKVCNRYGEGSLRCQGDASVSPGAQLMIGSVVAFPSGVRVGEVIDHD